MRVTLTELNLAELRALTRQHHLQPSYDRDELIRNLRAALNTLEPTQTPDTAKQLPLFFSEDLSNTPDIPPFSPSPRGGRGAPGGFA